MIYLKRKGSSLFGRFQLKKDKNTFQLVAHTIPTKFKDQEHYNEYFEQLDTISKIFVNQYILTDEMEKIKEEIS